MLPIVLILSVFGAVAVESVPVASQNSTDDGPLALALAVKSTLESLATGKPSAYLVGAMKDIEAKADVLLEIYDRPIGELSDFVKTKTQTGGAAYVIAAELNADLTVLSEFADKLKQAVEAEDNEAIIENVISIKVTASRVARELSSLGNATITYDPNLGERLASAQTARCKPDASAVPTAPNDAAYSASKFEGMARCLINGQPKIAGNEFASRLTHHLIAVV